jgi:hypothetical protein
MNFQKQVPKILESQQSHIEKPLNTITHAHTRTHTHTHFHAYTNEHSNIHNHTRK